LSLDRLWSPWRLEYITGHKPDSGCVFCDAPRPSQPDSLIVHEGSACYVILNKFPYNNGHLMAVPYRHVDSLAALLPDELNELARLIQLSESVLLDAYQPQGINVGINLGRAAGAGILEHIHIHAVPRWIGDSNFMTAIGETRVLPESLESTAKKLRPIFERLAGREGTSPRATIP
jgi:ATP adenylyltransferase